MSKNKQTHIIYSGLGGHKDYVLNLVDSSNNDQFSIIFYGIESIPKITEQELTQKGIKYKMMIKKRGLDLKALKSLRNAIKKYNNAQLFVHVNSVIFWIFLFSRFRKNKIYFIEHQANHLKTHKDWVYSKLGILLSRKVIYLTKLYKEQVKKKTPFFFSNKKSTIISTGISKKWFDSVKAPGDTNEIIKIGMQSRVVPIKDHPTLLKATAKLIKIEGLKIELSIAGDGSEMETLKNLTRELNIENQVQFLGHLNSDALISFLDQLDIYIHATHGETLSIALIQASARKKPIIASNVDGVNNFIADGETGVLYENNSVVDLVNKIKLLINNQNLRSKLAENSYNFALTKYTTETMKRKYKELINK